MTRSIIFSLLIALGISFSVSSCGGCLGGGSGGKANVQSTTKTTTLGQELKDLDAAHKKGIISDEEYEKKKKELLESKQ
jgi:hypothetical protein